MSNDPNNVAGKPDDEMLTLEEQALFDSVFGDEADSGEDRWNLTDDWVEQLLRRIENETPSNDLPETKASVDSDQHELIEVIDLSQEREARRRPTLALVACVLLFVVGVGSAVALGGFGADARPDSVAVIPASQQVDAPQLTPLDVPDGTTQFLNAGNGTTVAVVESPTTDESYLSISTDLVNWENSEALPIVDAIADVSTDTWYVVGPKSEALFDSGGPIGDVPTEVAGYSSDDFGQTWRPIEMIPHGEPVMVDDAGNEIGIPHTKFWTFEPSIAVVDDQLLIAYSTAPITNWTQVARDLGLVDDETTVIYDGGERWFAYGPGTFEEIEITASDLGLSSDDFFDLSFTLLELRVQRSVAGAPFELVELPRTDLLVGSVEVVGERFVLSADQPAGVIISSIVFESTDGLSWSESSHEPLSETLWFDDDGGFPGLGDLLFTRGDRNIDFDGTLVDQPDWQVRLAVDEGLIAEQSSTGSATWNFVPAPGVEAQLIGGFATDFGAALVWQNEYAESLQGGAAVVEDNGYIFELYDGLRLTVTDPNGVVLSERRSMMSIVDGRVLVERASDVVVVGEQGEVVASAGYEDFETAYFRSGRRIENPPARFISWASGPETWSFAELEGIDSAIWNFTVIDGGMLASAIDDPSEVLLIEWPEEFGE